MLFAFFVFAAAAVAVTPEECVDKGLCPTSGSALLQTASAINSDTIASHGAAAEGEESEVVKKVNLGTAANYAILTKTGTSTVPDSRIIGNIGVSPAAGTFMTGFSFTADASAEFSRSTQITGAAYAPTDYPPTPAKLTTAVSDMETAYTDARSRANTRGLNIGHDNSGNISGMLLTPGVYTFDKDINIGSDITFNGNAEDVFILQTTNSVLQSASTSVILEGGAQAKNIFWQVAERVLVGTGSLMQGILLVKTDVVFETSSSLNGRVLAQTFCTLKMATITQP